MKLGSLQVCYIAPVPSRYIPVNYRKMNVNYSKFIKVASGILAVALTQINIYASELNTDKALSKLDVAGFEMLKVGQRIGYWVCIVMAIMEIIKSVKDGNANAFWGIIIKYAMAFGSLYMLPWVFDLIAGIFG